ncbi:MAG: fibrobacter succinogenes major paralogous domain-containing protein, partial [Methanosarcina sp.]
MYYRYILIIALFILGYSCRRDTYDPPVITIPVIITGEVSNVSQTAAVSGGDIVNDGGSALISRGVCWNSSQKPTILDFHTTDGNGSGSYSSVLTDLSAGTKYFVRAYATNGEGTAYGNELSFSTNPASLAVIDAGYASSITFSSAAVTGSIKSDGGSPIIARGICWSINPWPEITDNKIEEGTGTGTFNCTLTGLQSSTLYYYSAYATNAMGTIYSVPKTFTTEASKTTPDIISEGITSITANSALGGGTILSEGGSAVTVRGICWSMSPNPTTGDNNLIDADSKRWFRINMNNLTMNTTYYVRAYATNSFGTSYGKQLVFITIPPGEVMDADQNVYKTVTLGTQVWMTENLKTTKYRDGSEIQKVTDNTEWSSLTTGAFCWYGNDETKYRNLYGAYYNFHAVNSGKLCPAGWHVPTDKEWTDLTTYLGGNSVGGKLKESGIYPNGSWLQPNSDATNETGFSARAGGQRLNTGSFQYVGYEGSWWCSREPSQSSAWYRTMGSMHGDVGRSWGDNKKQGYTVRCLKDNPGI